MLLKRYVRRVELQPLTHSPATMSAPPPPRRHTPPPARLGSATHPLLFFLPLALLSVGLGRRSSGAPLPPLRRDSPSLGSS